MSLGLVVSEEKSLTRTRTSTPQSDDIKTINEITYLSQVGNHTDNKHQSEINIKSAKL